MKRFWTFLLAVLMLSLGLLTACDNGTPPESNTGTESATDAQANMTTAPEKAETDPIPFAFESLAIAGNDISKYTIIYSISPYYYTFYTFENEDDFDRLTAEKLSDFIFEAFHVRLNVKQDLGTPVGEYEILVGETNRPESATTDVKDLALDHFVFKTVGNKLVINGGTYGTTWHAVDALEAFLNTKEAANQPKVDITASDDLSGTYDIQVIACVGDSITSGYGSATDADAFSYPANLQRNLWRDYYVYNFGECSKTMRQDIANTVGLHKTGPYTLSETYQAMMACEESFDLVLIMLGTNDSRKDGDWSTADSAKFKTDTRALIDVIKAKHSNAQFAIMNCPVVYRESTPAFGEAFICELQLEAAKELRAAGYPISFFDMRSFTTKSMPDTLFKDGLHPNNNGYAVMAAEVATFVKAVMEEGEICEYLVDLSK